MDSRTFSPPIQSIWIEEDQFMEKIYGFQVDQLLEPNGDTDKFFRSVTREEGDDEEEEDQTTRILIVNSTTPLLGNKSNISLEKTINSLDTETQGSSKDLSTMNKTVSLPQKLLKVLSKNQIINRMRSKVVERNILYSTKISSISDPFQFQHISHGEHQMKPTLERINDTSTRVQKQEERTETISEDCDATTVFSTMTSKTSVAFSAFCTPKLKSESVNSSEIFNLERKYETLSLSSPTTLVTGSPFRQSVQY